MFKINIFRNLNHATLLFVTAVLLSGCARQVHMDLSADSFVLEFYKDGLLVTKENVNNHQYSRLLQNFINSSEWELDFNSYAPCSMIRSESAVLNICSNSLVLNYTNDGDSWSQVSRDRTSSDESTIKALLNKK